MASNFWPFFFFEPCLVLFQFFSFSSSFSATGLSLSDLFCSKTFLHNCLLLLLSLSQMVFKLSHEEERGKREREREGESVRKRGRREKTVLRQNFLRWPRKKIWCNLLFFVFYFAPKILKSVLRRRVLKDELFVGQDTKCANCFGALTFYPPTARFLLLWGNIWSPFMQSTRSHTSTQSKT